MGKPVVVSLGRIVADQVPIEAQEAHAVLDQLWQRIRASSDSDGAMIAVPTLDRMGLTPFGDFELRQTAVNGARGAHPPHRVAHDLGRVLQRLLSTRQPAPDDAAGVCIDAALRASSTKPLRGAPRIGSPEELLSAIEPYRPRDPSATLAALYARWRRTTDRSAEQWRTMLTANPLLAVPTARTAVPPTHTRDPLAAAVGRRAPSLLVSGGSSSTTRRWQAAAVSAVALLLVLDAAGTQWVSLWPMELARKQDGAATTDSRLAATSDAPASSVSQTEVDLSPPSVARPARADQPAVRRILSTATAGRPPYSPSFGPRTDAIVFHAGREHTSLLQASLRRDGAIAGISTMREDGSRSYHAQVSPDGEHIAYDSDADGTRGVYIANQDGSAPRRVSGTGYASVPTWSPDGRYVAFARAEPNRPRVWNVWTVHVPTGLRKQRTWHRMGQPWGASWFPDGRRIAYSLEDRLIVRALETGPSRSYPTPVPGRVVRTPAVSPDGSRIVFEVCGDGAWVLDVQTGHATRVLDDAYAEEFAWSPDGRRIAYHSGRGGERGIWLLEMDLAP